MPRSYKKAKIQGQIHKGRIEHSTTEIISSQITITLEQTNIVDEDKIPQRLPICIKCQDEYANFQNLFQHGANPVSIGHISQ